jgi:hypothetical protein
MDVNPALFWSQRIDLDLVRNMHEQVGVDRGIVQSKQAEPVSFFMEESGFSTACSRRSGEAKASPVKESRKSPLFNTKSLSLFKVKTVVTTHRALITPSKSPPSLSSLGYV